MYYYSRIYTANFAKKRDFDKKLKDVQSKKKKKKLNELSKKVKAILTNGLTKDWIFLMEQNIFL